MGARKLRTKKAMTKSSAMEIENHIVDIGHSSIIPVRALQEGDVALAERIVDALVERFGLSYFAL